MNRHAKAPSAFTHGRSAALVLVLAAMALLVLAPAVFAAKKVDSFVGSPTGATGTTGGLFNSPRGIAVNQNGTGGALAGDFYVVDAGNRRVQQFRTNGTFVRAWGQDVIIATGPPPNSNGTGFEICDTTAGNVASECKQGIATGTTANGGQLNSPGGIAIDQATGNVYVTDAGNRRISVFSATGTFLRTFGWDVQVGGVTTFEICSVASECKQGATGSGANGGQLPGAEFSLAVDSTGHIYVADGPNRRVQKFDNTGAFVSAWAWDVIPAGKPGDTGTGLEACPASAANTAGDCQAGSFGTGLGQFGSPSTPRRVAVDSTGRVYAGEESSSSVPSRVQTFNSVGGSPAIFGQAALWNNSSSSTPIEMAIGASDRVFLIEPCTAALCPDAAVATERRIKELSSAGTLLDTHMVGAGFTAVNGLAANTTSGNLYVSTSGGTAGHRVWTLDNDGASPPIVTITPAAEVTEHTATLTGTVNPDGPAGFPTSYRFEYSRNGATWTRLPAADVSLGDGTSPVAVSQVASGLEADTFYRFRIVATKAFGSATATSAELTFLTDSVTPEVKTISPQNFGDDFAQLSGRINPNNKPTTYYFEYGETTSYGTKAPVPDASASGGTEQFFSTVVGGLQPQTTYHYRLVAKNQEGTTTGNDVTFTTREAFAGFPARGYEQVTPVDKNGAALQRPWIPVTGNSAFTGQGTGLNFTGAPGPIAPDGSAAVFGSWEAFGDAEWGSAVGLSSEGSFLYQARRDPDGTGWTTKATIPRPPGMNEVLEPLMFTQPTLYGGPGDSKAAFYSQYPMDEPAQIENIPFVGTFIFNTAAYLREWSSGDLTEVIDQVLNATPAEVVGGSADFSHAIFESEAVLTSEPGIPFSGRKVYEYADGQARLVSVSPGGTPFTTGSSLGRYNLSAQQRVTKSAVSDDGEHVFFSTPVGFSATPPAATKIYRRSGGTTTTLVSPSKATVPDPLGERGKVFSAATPDGDRVFFMSAQHLTDDANTGPSRAGRDLYRYDASSDALLDISAETNDANGAQVRGVLGVSDDGNRVYYVARGQVIAGKGVAGGNNVYLWIDDGSADGETRFIATLAPDSSEGVSFNDARNLGADIESGTQRLSTARVTPDGSALLFQSGGKPSGFDNAGFAQIYLYEAGADEGEGALSCVSCPRDGLAPTGHSTVPYSGIASESGDSFARFLSDDGKRVVFQSLDELLAEDTNGFQDIYVWEAGRLQMITPGNDPEARHASLWGMSESGDDLFFMTNSRLVGQDVDAAPDIYDARVGGGIPEQSPPPPGEICTGEACKPAAPVTAPQSQPGSTSAGPGNVKEGRGKKRRCAKGKVRVKRKCVAKKSKKSKKAGKARSQRGRGGQK